MRLPLNVAINARGTWYNESLVGELSELSASTIKAKKNLVSFIVFAYCADQVMPGIDRHVHRASKAVFQAVPPSSKKAGRCKSYGSSWCCGSYGGCRGYCLAYGPFNLYKGKVTDFQVFM